MVNIYLHHFAEIIEVTGVPPPSASENITRRGRLGETKVARRGIYLKIILLVVGATCNNPASNEESKYEESAITAYATGSSNQRMYSNGVKERIKKKAAPGELEADALGKEVVSIEMDKLVVEVLNHKPGHHEGIQQHGI